MVMVKQEFMEKLMAKKVISTKDNPVASLAPPDDFSSEDVLNELIGMFKKLIERMKN